ncbi:hypothetical protein F511_29917 [Dorcoceras hygrometricum]|uniref:Uncharacterized protein n=1 Tax=Dorcoceras hygrometricum TaxID=472368 RepID=A0A2Z7B5E1_9LAMI|nr:hypothetical protein F511_29917 [Dorcoceras hygrometricum]
MDSRRFRWLFCSCEVALDSSREALPLYTSFRSCIWLVEEREVAAVRVLCRPGCEGERRYRTLISLLGSLATMSRVVNYHSSWARQQQGELFDASGILGVVSWRVAHYHTMNTPRGHYLLLMILGAMFEFLSSLEGRAFRNPGFTAGRGFNPDGGAPGGG